MKQIKTDATVSHPLNAPNSAQFSFWLKIVILIQFLLLAWQFYPAPSTNGDNAKYFILGTALSRFQGYKQLHLPGEPIETQYPVVYPLFLGIIQFFSGTLLSSKIVMAGIGVLLTILFFYFGKSFTGYLIIPLLFLLATSSLLLEHSVVCMSDVPYLLLILLALYTADASIRKPRRRLLFFTATILSVLPVHCRSVGITFCGAYILDNIISKRYRYAAVHLLLLIGTMVLFRSLTSWHSPYSLQLFLKNSYNPEMGYASGVEIVLRIGTNVKKYLSFITGNSLCPLAYSLPGVFRAFFSALCVFLMMAGGIRTFFSSQRIISLYVLFYFGVLFLWQSQWSSERFLVGVLPFLFMFLMFGIDLLLEMTGGEGGSLVKRFMKTANVPLAMHPARKRYVTVWVVTAVMVIGNVGHLAKQAAANRRLSPDWTNYYSCADWLRVNTPDRTVVMSRKPELLYLRAKRKGILYPFTHDVDKVVAVLRKEKIRYVVLDNFSWTRTTVRYLFPVIQCYPGLFRVVYALRDPDTYILEFVDK